MKHEFRAIEVNRQLNQDYLNIFIQQCNISSQKLFLTNLRYSANKPAQLDVSVINKKTIAVIAKFGSKGDRPDTDYQTCFRSKKVAG